jgi:hypothetical protein
MRSSHLWRRRGSVRRAALPVVALLAMVAAMVPAWHLVTASAGSGVVQTFGAATATGSATLSARPPAATTAGDLLVATVRDRNVTSPAPVLSVADSASNPWVRAASAVQGQADGEIWYVANAASLSSAQAVTVTVGGSAASTSAIALTVLEVSGDASTALDVTASAGGSGTAASTGTTAATAQPSEIAIAVAGWNGAATPSGQTVGYSTTTIEQAKVSGAQAGEQAAWRQLSATGQQSYAATLSSAVAWTGAIATFRTATSPTPTPTSTPPPTGADWPAYMHDASGSGFTSETLINPASASSLQPKAGWPVALSNGAVCPSASDTCSNMVFSQPTVATLGGSTLVYVGSWNGSEYAVCASSCTVGATTYSTGQVVWQAYLGRNSGCGGRLNSAIQGVTSAATVVASVAIGGVTQPVVFVGGGGDIALSGAAVSGATAQVMALNALTGAVLWHTSLGSAPSHYSWSSPLYANGSLYVGLSSQGDCPLVQGKLVQLSTAKGTVLHSFAVVPSGCLGGSVWGSASADASGNIYVVTGNPGGRCTGNSIQYSPAILRLSPSLVLQSHWQIPAAEQVVDSDFGSTPTFFSGTVTPGGTMTSLVGAVNKNGLYYVFDQNNIGAGPVQRMRISTGIGNNFKGQSISPSSWDGSTLYVAGGNTTINGTAYTGALRAFDPNNLSTPLWEDGFTSGTVIGAVTTDPGLAVVGHAGTVTVVNSATGVVTFNDSSGTFWGAASVARGVVYIGDTTGGLHAYSVNGL